jgi:hypothetical protein
LPFVAPASRTVERHDPSTDTTVSCAVSCGAAIAAGSGAKRTHARPSDSMRTSARIAGPSSTPSGFGHASIARDVPGVVGAPSD